MKREITALRAHTLAHLLFAPTTLRSAIDRLGFVQADPIRSPAPAQDLILRHRVAGYRADDLVKAYATLDVEEGLIYAYGFMPRRVWQLVRTRVARPLSAYEERVLALVRERTRVGPRDLDALLGRLRVRGDWGGQASAAKHALEALHRRGHLRVAGREKGLRVYEAAPSIEEEIAPIERLRRLALVVAGSMGPVPRRSLQATLAPIGRALVATGAGRTVLSDLLKSGELIEGTFDGTPYVWPLQAFMPEPAAPESAAPALRLLAPFDPIVRDRARFEQLWGWTYRFEAYTPLEKRTHGYYAMPLLWRDAVIGWANVTLAGTKLDVSLGFVRSRPREKAFASALDAEIARLEAFLGLGAPQGGSRVHRSGR
jgi:uncharacterized protein YcaQ